MRNAQALGWVRTHGCDVFDFEVPAEKPSEDEPGIAMKLV